MSAHDDLAAARLEALNMRTERDVAQAEVAALRELAARILAEVGTAYRHLGDLHIAASRLLEDDA